MKTIFSLVLAAFYATTPGAQIDRAADIAALRTRLETDSKFASALMSRKLLNENTQLLITGKVETGRGGRYAYGFVHA